MAASGSTNQELRLAISLDSSKATAAAYTLPQSNGVSLQPAKIHGFAKVDTSFVAPSGPRSLREASDVILELTEAVENQTSEHFSDSLVTFASPSLQFGGQSVRLELRSERVGKRDIAELDRLWYHPNQSQAASGMHTYLRLRTPYRVDRNTITAEPEGLAAHSLARTEVAFSERKTTVLNWIEAFRLCGLKIRRFVPQPLGSLMAATTSHERKQGIMVVDIGHTLTQVIVARDHLVRDCRIYTLGGDRITEDLSICLKIDPADAEALKKSTAPGWSASTSVQGRMTPEGNLAPDIIAARAVELARRLRHVAEANFRPRDYVGGVVLVGGSSKMTGLIQEFRNQVHPLCRTVSKFGMTGLTELIDDPGFASLAGSLILDAGSDDNMTILDHLPLESGRKRTGPMAMIGKLFSGRMDG